jgi:hypothetical protein
MAVIIFNYIFNKHKLKCINLIINIDKKSLLFSY